MNGGRFQCCCVWAEVQCPNTATQEDGLCDWCGKRTRKQMAANPKAIFHAVTGEFVGIGGRGEAHVDPNRSPDACWMLGSGAHRVGTTQL